MANKLAEMVPAEFKPVVIELTRMQARELRDVIDRVEAINMATTGSERQALGYVSQLIHMALGE